MKTEKTLIRCAWPKGDPLYQKYHDEEWGRPVYDDQKIFECLTLESAQAGLSWITILRKRENYRKAFAQFDPEKVARFGEARIKKLVLDPGIIRYELKIRAAINNAQRFLEVQKEFGTFSKYIWGFVNARVIDRKGKGFRATSPESDRLAADLKIRGFKFLGSTTLYAHMQATGMVNDHIEKCLCRAEISPAPSKREVPKIKKAGV